VEKERNKAGRPITMPAPWGELFKLAGGQKKLAERLGVSKSTVGKWAADVHRVPVLAMKELLHLCEQHGIREGLEQFNVMAQKN
jgi:transcriptional regulator with XRE-family HTH domain